MAENYTENLGLPLWGDSDGFNSTNINTSNEILDAKLAHFTTEAIYHYSAEDINTSEIVVPLDEIDWSRYREVVIDYTVVNPATSLTCQVHPNSEDTSVTARQLISSNSYTAMSFQYTGVPSTIKFMVNYRPDKIPIGTAYGYNLIAFYMTSITYSSLYNIVISPSSNSGVFTGSCDIKIWGVL